MRAAAVSALALVAAGCHTRPDPAVVRQRVAALYGPQAASPASTAEPDEAPAADEVVAQRGLELYLRYGLHNNAALRAEYRRWRSALERIPQVSSLPDPVFTFAQFVENVETRTGPQERRYSLSQTFPWFGELDLRASAAGAAAEEQWFRVQEVRLGVERDIRIAYYDYAYLAESMRITREVLELLMQLELVVQQRVASAQEGQQGLLRLQVEIGRLENELESLQEVRPSLSARLAAAMTLRRREVLPLPELVAPDLARVGSGLDALLSRAAQDNPELRALQQRIRKGERDRELAALQRWPELTVGVDYIETGDAVAPVAGSGDDPYALRLMFNLPIWGARYDAAEREAEHDISAASHALDDRRVTLRADLQHAAFELDDAARQVELYRRTLLPRAQESLEVTRAAYRAGSSTILHLIDSERTLLEFETGYWRACRDHHQSKARLEALLGGRL